MLKRSNKDSEKPHQASKKQALHILDRLDAI